MKNISAWAVVVGNEAKNEVLSLDFTREDARQQLRQAKAKGMNAKMVKLAFEKEAR